MIAIAVTLKALMAQLPPIKCSAVTSYDHQTGYNMKNDPESPEGERFSNTDCLIGRNSGLSTSVAPTGIPTVLAQTLIHRFCPLMVPSSSLRNTLIFTMNIGFSSSTTFVLRITLSKYRIGLATYLSSFHDRERW